MSVPPGSPCVICKRSEEAFAGKERCPLMVKFYSRSRTVKLMDSLDLAGMSPPSVFVGRFRVPEGRYWPPRPPFDVRYIINGYTRDVGRQDHAYEIVDFKLSLVQGKA